jgi:N-acetylneuraminic acid mutarotase
MICPPSVCLLAGKALGDMHRYDPVNRTWTEVDIPAGSAPAARAYAGVAEAEGQLYLFGGSNGTGLCRPPIATFRLRR